MLEKVKRVIQTKKMKLDELAYDTLATRSVILESLRAEDFNSS